MKNHLIASLACCLLAPASAEEPLRLHGVVEPIRWHEVKAEVGGRIGKLHVDYAVRVKTGDLLVAIEQPEGDIASPKAKVLSPGDGVVVGIHVEKGQAVTAGDAGGGTKLLSIADDSRFMVEAHGSEAVASRLALRQHVEFTADAFPKRRFDAAILYFVRTAKVVDGVKGFTVRALVEKTEASTHLRPGMTVEITVPIAKSASK